VSWELILVLGGLTYASRAAALVLLPSLPDGVRTILDRVPAALFAGLAMHSLVVPGVGLAAAPILAAAAGAVAVAPLRSLPLSLIAGICGYLLWGLVA
jgi:branched-subunit amino acid transport protein